MNVVKALVLSDPRTTFFPLEEKNKFNMECWKDGTIELKKWRTVGKGIMFSKMYEYLVFTVMY
jgi:hypothetical protein